MMGRTAFTRLALASAMGIFSVTPAYAQPVAEFDYVEYRDGNSEAAEQAGTYHNPLLPGFQPDPSIVRVGEDFYLVTSTFSWLPGLPIYHSRDLVHWKLVGHGITTDGVLALQGLETNRGLFAPAISYHDETYWIVNTCVGCKGNFVITATDPSGPWSEPVWLPFGGIDPSLFFGEDGRAWIVYNDAPPGEAKYEGHRALWLQQFDPLNKTLLGERILLVDGGVDPTQEPVWAEGPHIYKVGEWFFLMAAEGGTADHHSETIYRARQIEGPYVPGPVNPILTQRDLPADRVDRVEATGHADLVQLADGSWWGVFLGTRPFAGQSTLMGRETFLLPVKWQDGWPRFLSPGEPVPMVASAPTLAPSPNSDWHNWRDEFVSDKLSGEWIALRSTPEGIPHLIKGGALRLVAGSAPAGSLEVPSFIGRRLRDHHAVYTTRIYFEPEHKGDFAGLLAFMDEDHFLSFGIEGAAQGRLLVIRRRMASSERQEGEVVASRTLRQDDPLELRLSIDDGSATAEFRRSGKGWEKLGEPVDIEPLASIHAGLFTGLVVGPYAVARQLTD